jgi:hypothetical protein
VGRGPTIRRARPSRLLCGLLLAAITTVTTAPARAGAEDGARPVHVDATAFGEATVVGEIGFKAGAGLDALWRISPRGSAGLVVRLSGALFPTDSVDGDLWLGDCDGHDHYEDYDCNGKRRGFLVTDLAAGFEVTVAKTVFLKARFGLELISSKEWEIYSLLPFPAFGLELAIRVSEKPRYALLIAPMFDAAFTYIQFEVLVSFGMGLTLRFL